MKKRILDKKISAILLVTALVLLLTACGGGSRDGATGAAMNASKAVQYATTTATEAPMYAAGDDYAMYEESASESGSLLSSGVANQGQYADKIIYSANADIETLHFDEAVQQVYDMVEFYHGFMESSYISGNNYASSYYGQQSYRRASFTIRVPSGSFTAVKGDMDKLGYVTSLETYSDNITTQFYDTQSRLDAYRAEAQRLTEMLAKADTVEDMITVEARLSDVQYNIDSLTSRLKNWQNSVDYSTVNLTLREVAEIRVTPSVTESYWQKMGKGFVSTLSAIGSFFKDLLLWLVTALPALVLLAVIALLVIFLVKRGLKKRAKRQMPPAAPQDPNDTPWKK